ncbi:MAG: hypothetical protein KC505_07195 [Myxococcales bacterium]|nr:hypothetical protein [Myxococcales bacterium]USN51136.1 MAG: hypothetical protein H6731_01625 [Myxococcales bacterium]
MNLTKLSLAIILAHSLYGHIGNARPDVYFSDSADYQGAYLAHELEGGYIKFKMSDEASNIRISDKWYKLSSLKSFTQNSYGFQNFALKQDFIEMFEQSFLSYFSTMEFIEELNRLLEAFSRAHRADVK